jgi:hypothetical protein
VSWGGVALLFSCGNLGLNRQISVWPVGLNSALNRLLRAQPLDEKDLERKLKKQHKVM